MRKASWFLMRAIIRFLFPYRSISDLIEIMADDVDLSSEDYCSIEHCIKASSYKAYRRSCRRILEDYQEIFSKSLVSEGEHCSWKGSYLDHVSEVMNIGVVLYKTFNSLRPLDFFLSDMLLVLFLYDLDTLFKVHDGDIYGDMGGMCRDKIIEKYDIVLSKEQNLALHHIADSEQSNMITNESAKLLVVMCHMAVFMSTHGWSHYPLQGSREDSWQGNPLDFIKEHTFAER